MLGRSKSNEANDRGSSLVQQMPRSAAASSASPEVSSISSGLSIIGKIVGHGALTIFGEVEGELRASTVLIAEKALSVQALRKGHATLIRRPHIGREILSFCSYLIRRT
jgi:hypothetical protein